MSSDVASRPTYGPILTILTLLRALKTKEMVVHVVDLVGWLAGWMVGTLGRKTR